MGSHRGATTQGYSMKVVFLICSLALSLSHAGVDRRGKRSLDVIQAAGQSALTAASSATGLGPAVLGTSAAALGLLAKYGLWRYLKKSPAPALTDTKSAEEFLPEDGWYLVSSKEFPLDLSLADAENNKYGEWVTRGERVADTEWVEVKDADFKDFISLSGSANVGPFGVSAGFGAIPVKQE